jgi:hypothetical protein
MFPALAVILSCVAIVVSVALSVVDCASESDVPTAENVIPVTKTNNTRTLDFVIHFIKEALLYKKLRFLHILRKDSSAALTTTILQIFKLSQSALPFRGARSYGQSSDVFLDLIMCSIFVSLARLCGYEGWVLPLFFVSFVVIRKKDYYHSTTANTRLE